MQAIFPGWKDSEKGDTRIVDAEVPDRDQQGKLSNDLVGSRLDIKPREVIRLDDTHAALITEGVEVTEDGERVDSHASGAWLGAYFFLHEPAGWTLEQRIDGVAYQGASGSYGQTNVIKLSAATFGLVVTSGSCWQGYCGSWATVFGIEPDHIDKLADTVPVSASNLGAKEECEAVLKRSEPASNHPGIAADSPQCFDIGGNIDVVPGTDAPGDLHIAFSGAMTIGDSATQAQSIDEVAIYRISNGKYTLTQGRNPVPAF
ncbi:hypothetical protein [Trinickia fusca]|uniref:Uncharacterized protein n=1 Tax=Trinickia fusca TaxID=2419777 RepID=A0A494XBL7_9BURK|nr:hypothetical protein [Trinickia fusca]RKP48227.1 hypothetical protein D7S89_12910 [Trinickia fusca]